jgi:hypothetical protein
MGSARPDFPKTLAEFQAQFARRYLAACRWPDAYHCPQMLTFRFNRRRTPMASFQTLLGLATLQGPTPYHGLYASESTG